MNNKKMAEFYDFKSNHALRFMRLDCGYLIGYKPMPLFLNKLVD
jgi:hypothetical protein